MNLIASATTKRPALLHQRCYTSAAIDWPLLNFFAFAQMQNPQAKGRMDVYFKRIAALAQSEKLESRIRFALKVRHTRILPKTCERKSFLLFQTFQTTLAR